MRKHKRRHLIWLLPALFVTGCSSAPGSCESTVTPTSNTSRTENIQDGAILHAFSWDFNTIRESLPAIAASGFRAVQTSPANTVLEGENGGMDLYGNGKWYYHYQPTDWKIGNYQLGTEEEFKLMAEEAENYGISIIVDVVPNHTTPTTDAISNDLIQAVGGSDKLFHDNGGLDLSNYTDRKQVTAWNMGGLPDVDTENPKFQEYFISYLDEIIDAGADGFRFDTAKHIALPDDPQFSDEANNFWPNVMEAIRAKGVTFSYGEVLQGQGDRIRDYVDMIGATTASNYGEKIRNAIQLKNLNPGSLMDFAAGDKSDLVTWVESHDNYINDGTWKELDDHQVEMAYAILAARKEGTPLFFDRPYQSSTEDKWGENRIGVSGSNLYQSDIVRAVNFFRTAMVKEDETLSNPNGDTTALMIERGKKGVVIVNLKNDLETGFELALADGCYTDRVSGTEFVVKNGKLESDTAIPADSVVVLYNEGFINTAAPVTLDVENAGFDTDKTSQTITLHVDEGSEGVWIFESDGEQSSGTFKDGDTLEISCPENGEALLTLQAKNSVQTPSWKQFVFRSSTKNIVKKGSVITLIKPSDWSETVNVYLYSDENPTRWPGEKMEKVSENEFRYTLEEDWENPLVIFNSGSSQIPAANEPGLELREDALTFDLSSQ